MDVLEKSIENILDEYGKFSKAYKFFKPVYMGMLNFYNYMVDSFIKSDASIPIIMGKIDWKHEDDVIVVSSDEGLILCPKEEYEEDPKFIQRKELFKPIYEAFKNYIIRYLDFKVEFSVNDDNIMNDDKKIENFIMQTDIPENKLYKLIMNEEWFDFDELAELFANVAVREDYKKDILKLSKDRKHWNNNLQKLKSKVLLL
jgi:hypothetical protein